MVKMHLRPAILLFGDSITQFSFGEAGVRSGWGSLLSSAYQRRADVFNRGFSGYNTRHALELVPRVFGSCDSGYLFCTLFFGANDAALRGERQHIPIEEYGDNLCKIIESIRRETGTDTKGSSEGNHVFPIILMTPPPVDDDQWKEELGSEDYDRTNENSRRYGEVVKKVAKKYADCEVLDTWELLEGHASHYSCHLSDGLHLSESGNKLVYEGLMDLIKKKYPHLAPQQYIDGGYTGGGIPVEEKLWDELC